MKKLALLSLVAATFAMPVLAADAVTPASTPSNSAAAPANAEAAASTIKSAASKKVELKDGNWAQVDADGTVKVSKDAGKTWTAAPDATWEAKDGSKLTTKGGKAAM